MGKPVEPPRTPDPAIPLIDRRDEVQALADALRHRRSRLILGPWGAGKTRLLRESLLDAQQPFVYMSRPAVLHDLLVRLARALWPRPNEFPDPRRATSVSLKPLLLEALRQRPLCVVVEDASDTDPRMYRFLQQVYYLPGTCLIVTARSRDRLGYVQKLLWDPREEIPVPPLGRRDAQRLFEEAVRAFRLGWLDVEDFRHKALRAAQGNPGQIVAMCRLAARPEYQAGRRVKFAPLRIDALSSFAE